MRSLASLLVLLALGTGCSSPDPEHELSAWGIFEDGASQTVVDGVVPYDLVSPLFSDYSSKHRFIRLPAGGQITYTDEGDFVWPEGTVIIKTFGFLHDLRDPSAGERIIETRLLSLEEGEWVPYVFVWNDDASAATRRPTGERVDVEWIHHDGSMRTLEYRVPNEVQCANCHGGSDPVTPIGPRAEQLDRTFDYGAGSENQLEHFASLGMFDAAIPAPAERHPLADPFGDAPVEDRARAYLDANCSHCHQEGGAAAQSGLWLNAFVPTSATIGICKRPVAAGRGAGGRLFDIVPGSPDESVMIYRMESEEAGIKMPELPSLLSHAEGVAVIREWITSMEPTGCTP